MYKGQGKHSSHLNPTRTATDLWRWLIFCLVAGSLLSIDLIAGGPFSPSHKPEGFHAKKRAYRTDRVLYKMKKNTSFQSALYSSRLAHAHHQRSYSHLGRIHMARVDPTMGVKKTLEALRKDPNVEGAEYDYQITLNLTPDDPYYVNGSLYGLNNTGSGGGLADADIDAPEAWNVQSTAANVIVGIIDTGIQYDHEDLAANVWTNPNEIPGNGIDDDGNGYIDDIHGINAITGTGDPMDDNGHGTHVSGTIGGVGNNGKGVVGVAWGVKLMACKFLDQNGSGYTSDALTCLDYAVANGAKVLNNSWGGGGFVESMSDTIQNMGKDHGVIFVAAAGNETTDNDTTPHYPSSYDADNVVSVASTDRNDQLSSFSNWGLNSVDIAAPGSSILSCWFSTPTAYATLSGTSMATPHVSGAIALLMARFPSENYRQTIARLLNTGDPLSSLAGKCSTGSRLNLYRALTADILSEFTVSSTSGTAPLTVNFKSNAIGNVTSYSWNFGDHTPTATTANPSHLFVKPGNYQVTLTVTGPSGSSTKTRLINVLGGYEIVPAAYSWIPPEGMTQITSALGDDAVSTPIALPFDFTYFGVKQNTIYVGSNGLAGFEGTELNRYDNTSIPDSTPPNSFLAPLWDDLNPTAGGMIYAGVVGTAPTRKFVVTWNQIPPFNGSNSTQSFTFQMILNENSNVITYQYKDVNLNHPTASQGREATIGIEGPTGGSGVLYSFNGSVLLNNEQAFSFSTVPLPAPWKEMTLGTMKYPGSATYAGNNAFCIESSGTDIWNGVDSAQFVYRPWVGDGTIIARVDSLLSTNAGAKSGVMFRETLDADSKNIFLGVTPTQVVMQRRNDTGGKTVSTKVTTAQPVWVKLQRSNNTFKSYYSQDGIQWTYFRQYYTTMSKNIYVGLALSSHNKSKVTNSQISNVEVSSPSNQSNLWIEAEEAAYQSNFGPLQVYSDAGAHDHLYIASNNSNRTSISINTTTGIASYPFTLSAPSSITLWIRAIIPSGASNSFFVDYDNTGWNTWGIFPYSETWKWYKWKTKTLPQGQHTLNIGYREVGSKLDSIILTTDSSLTPESLQSVPK